MFGQNPKRAPLQGDGSILEVKNIFKTIQGEGPFVGTPSVFIRLGGCNLACKFCDTEFEDFRSLKLYEIIKTVCEQAKNCDGIVTTKLVVITGGEPLRQPIEALCQALIDLGFTVQIETNGKLYRELPKDVQIVCSPKASGGNYQMIREDLLPRINAIKMLVSSQIEKYSRVGEVGQTKYNIPVYLQPMDEYDPVINQKNMQLAIELAEQTGYRISIQTHKILGIE